MAGRNPRLILMPHKEGFKKLIKEHLPYSNAKICGIEIGCFKGEFCCSLLEEFDNLSMITIDPSPFWLDVIQHKVMNRLWIINLPSDIAINLLRLDNRLYDFLFIDGDHSYEQCKKDIMNYYHLVKDGGIVAGHNYHKDPNSAHPGVHKAVDEIFDNKVNFQSDYIWWIKK